MIPKGPYKFVIFQWGGGPDSRPTQLDPRMMHYRNKGFAKMDNQISIRYWGISRFSCIHYSA